MRLVYLSPVPWASFAQRPHKFVEWFQGASGGQILWIDPYPTRLPSWSDLRGSREISIPSIETLPLGLSVITPQAFPIEPLPWSGAVNRLLWTKIFISVQEFCLAGPTILGIGKPSELALQLLSTDGFQSTFYDAMDDFPAFYKGLSRRAMARREQKVIDRVSSVLVSSSELRSRWLDSNNILLTRNACDTQLIAEIAGATLSQKKPILGYVGTIGNWFDWDLLAAIADAIPSMEVRLIGPVFTPSPLKLPENVRFFPPCTHEVALAAMREFSIGLIPFKENRLTRSVDPIKYYEYRAWGLPVLSSVFGEMRLHQNDSGVFLIDSISGGDALRGQIDAALAYETSTFEVEEFRKSNSWESRFTATGLLQRNL